MNYRDITGYAREPMQQAMVRPSADYPHLYAMGLEVGVILAVYPADSTYNRTRMESRTKRGWRHECTVQLVGSGQGGESTITGVVIPPTGPSGVHNYNEALPKGCTQTFKEGGTFDPNLQLSAPEELDGDWCVVGYVRNDRDQPFIVQWWPNPNNSLDASTSGNGNPNSSGEGMALDQVGRSLSRVNGVEKTITRQGNVYFDTSLAGDPIDIRKPTKNGRYARQRAEAGGNIRVIVKPSASVELDFNDPPNGIGVLDQPDPQITQENPPPPASTAAIKRNNTYLVISKSMLQLKCSDSIDITSAFSTIRGSNILSLVGDSISVGDVDTKYNLDADISATTVNKSTTTTQEFTIDDGSGTSLPLLNSNASSSFSTALALAALDELVVGTPEGNGTAITAIIGVLNSLANALETGQTVTLKST